MSEENIIRSMRDEVYGPGTQNNWDGCKDKWLRTEETEWLCEQVRKLKK